MGRSRMVDPPENDDFTRPVALKTEDSAPKSSKWAEIRATLFTDPASRERYVRKRASYLTIRRMLLAIDDARERAGLSKTDLARQIGVSPATVRRLFTSPTSNPTLKTITDLAAALDLEIEVRARPDAPGVGSPESHRIEIPSPTTASR